MIPEYVHVMMKSLEAMSERMRQLFGHDLSTLTFNGIQVSPFKSTVVFWLYPPEHGLLMSGWYYPATL